MYIYIKSSDALPSHVKQDDINSFCNMQITIHMASWKDMWKFCYWLYSLRNVTKRCNNDVRKRNHFVLRVLKAHTHECHLLMLTLGVFPNAGPWMWEKIVHDSRKTLLQKQTNNQTNKTNSPNKPNASSLLLIRTLLTITGDHRRPGKLMFSHTALSGSASSVVSQAHIPAPLTRNLCRAYGVPDRCSEQQQE